jgi:hypothetical protein
MGRHCRPPDPQRLARRVRSPTATLIVASIPTVAAMLWGSGNPASDRGVAGAADCRGLSVPRPGTPDRYVTVLKFLRSLLYDVLYSNGGGQSPYTVRNVVGARSISRMSPWWTLPTCPLSQAIVTAAQLVSVTMPPSPASPRQNTRVPFLRFLDSVTVICSLRCPLTRGGNATASAPAFNRVRQVLR